MKKLTEIGFVFVIALCAWAMVPAQQAASQDKPGTQVGSAATATPVDTRIPRDSKVYIAPMDGFETYLSAAFRNKGVPLVIVVDRDQADFEITGTHEKKNAGWAKTIFVSPNPSASASMQVVNLKTKVVVYADSSHRTTANRGERSTAEKLAKYLKKKIEDDEKKSK